MIQLSIIPLPINTFFYKNSLTLELKFYPIYRIHPFPFLPPYKLPSVHHPTPLFIPAPPPWFKVIIRECIKEHIESIGDSCINRMFTELNKGLGYQYHSSWLFVLQCLSDFIQVRVVGIEFYNHNFFHNVNIVCVLKTSSIYFSCKMQAFIHSNSHIFTDIL